MKDIVIIGAGGFGREVAQLIEEINLEHKTWNLLGYIDETPEKQNTIINDVPVLGNFDWFSSHSHQSLLAICAIGNPRAKYSILRKASTNHLNFASLIHPDAKVTKYTEVGTDTIICCYSFVSVNTKIGNHVCISPGCGIGHDAVIHDYTSLYWNVTLAGDVCVHEGCELGSKSVIIPKKSIGKWSTLGAGAVVTKDIPDYCTAVGVPAKPIKFLEPEKQ